MWLYFCDFCGFCVQHGQGCAGFLEMASVLLDFFLQALLFERR